MSQEGSRATTRQNPATPGHATPGHATPGHAAPETRTGDWRPYFEGEWLLSKTIEHFNGAGTATFEGRAVFTRNETALGYAENGVMRVADMVLPSETRQNWRFPSYHVVEIDFADGRFFCTFDLSEAPAHTTHDCPPDVYRGTLRPEGDDCWRLIWRAKGPRKDYMSVAEYRRP